MLDFTACSYRLNGSDACSGIGNESVPKSIIDIFISPVKADKFTNKSRQRNTGKTHTHTHTHTHSGLIGQIKQKYTN